MTDVPGLDVAGLAAWIDRVHPELSPEPAPAPEPEPEPKGPPRIGQDKRGFTFSS